MRKGYVDKTSTEESKTHIVRSKKSKYDLQPYIGSNSCGVVISKHDNLIFSLS